MAVITSMINLHDNVTLIWYAKKCLIATARLNTSIRYVHAGKTYDNALDIKHIALIKKVNLNIGLRTRSPEAFPVIWVLETLQWRYVRKELIWISTAPS